ncbi:MAG: hypothetical protein OET79_02735 [Nitrospirota bacterium]|nr:hypothetical protein [Nitrospirota bacterium]
MCFLFSLIPATIYAVIGYFVLFSSTKVEGGVHKFGRGLAIWIFILALFFPIMGAYVTIAGLCPMEKIMEQIMEEK